MVTFALPFPPSLNNLFAHGRVGNRIRRFPTRTYKAWRQEAVLRINVTRPKVRFNGPVGCTIDLVPPNNRRRDADNFSKGILDALTEAGVLHDDSQVKEISVTMHAAGDTPGATVRLASLAA